MRNCQIANWSLIVIAALGLGFSHGCSTLTRVSRLPANANDVDLNQPIELESGESVATIVGTNDVHGHFLTELPQVDLDSGVAAPTGPAANVKLGGQDWFSGYISAIRAGDAAWYGQSGSTLLLDAGDMAQGTIVSNMNEGMLAAELMKSLKYDAAIPGNHAYDFGPIGWQIDQCAVGDSTCDPLAALERFQTALRDANIPLLGANVMLAGKKPSQIAPFLKPFTLIPFQGRNIAVIGLDNPGTRATTYAMNVVSLDFTPGIAETVATVAQLKSENLADVFVIVAHNGDIPAEPTTGTPADTPLLKFLDALPKNADGTPLVDAAIVGHTHVTESGVENGIPYIQSNWGGKYFGIIQLLMTKDSAGHLVVEHSKTRQLAAIPIVPNASKIMGQSVQQDPNVSGLLQDAEKLADPLANERIGTLSSALSDSGKRLADSVIGNFVADMMNAAAGSQVSVIGSGDIRMGIEEPPDRVMTYNDLFNVIPKQLQLVDVPRMPLAMFNANLTLSIQTCGDRGALQISGMTIYFTRNCQNAVNGLDPAAKLVRVVASNGEVLFPPSTTVTTVNVSTTDFILTGGAGYNAFEALTKTPEGIESISTVGPMRDLMIKKIQALPAISASDYAVGRYVNCSDSANSSVPECTSTPTRTKGRGKR